MKSNDPDVTTMVQYIEVMIEKWRNKETGVFPPVAAMTMSMSNEAWRVEIKPSGAVELLHIGMEGRKYPNTTVYPTEDDVPEWVADRLSMLRMLTDSDPTSYVNGVGRRVNEKVFWIEGEEDAEV